MKSIKVGIITFHFSDNFGALLQSFALTTFLESSHYNCEIIDYTPELVKNKTFISSIIRKIVMIQKTFNRKSIKKYKAGIEKFRNDYLPISASKYLNILDLKKCNSVYDVFICGSDQIWNYNIVQDSAYYLHFAEKSKPLISYAASFGIKNIEKSKKDFIINGLKNINIISCRETSGCEFVENQTLKSCTQVLDPVFLLDKNRWLYFMRDAKPTLPKGNFILVYLLEYSKEINLLISNIKKIYKKNIIVIAPIFDYITIKHKRVFPSTPFEFLYYINNADLIVTNSFHGSAFSVLFRKNFIVLPANEKGTRIEEMLTAFGLHSQICGSLTMETIKSNYYVDYSHANILIKNEVEKSSSFLLEALAKSNRLSRVSK